MLLVFNIRGICEEESAQAGVSNFSTLFVHIITIILLVIRLQIILVIRLQTKIGRYNCV